MLLMGKLFDLFPGERAAQSGNSLKALIDPRRRGAQAEDAIFEAKLNTVALSDAKLTTELYRDSHLALARNQSLDRRHGPLPTVYY